ncbi:hypothetical protein [Massilia horti]|uniref:hypothetical protein n=1 Tax=Massilia horti TaxID=2562153 RepID=UPI0014321678|nr:hypothetical protein [Massilia horti]
MNIELHMERLVLDGVDLPPWERRQLQAAVEAELSSLLGDGKLVSGLAVRARLQQLAGQAIELAPGCDPARLGRQIAQSVFGSIAARVWEAYPGVRAEPAGAAPAQGQESVSRE